MRSPVFLLPLFPVTVAVTVLSLLATGCGTVEETTETHETWTPPPAPVANTARLEYRIDSLMNENRRLRQQVDAMSSETRSLNARNAELELKLTEAAAKPVVVTPVPTVPTDHTSAYSAALSEYRKRNFAGAAQQFEGLLKAGIREDLADNCHYWIGESYYGLGKYSQALEHFQMVFNYARSEKKDDSQMMIGNCHLAMRNNAAAREAFNKLITTYPASAYARRAQEKLSAIR